ncbi:MAG TPA: cytochrome c biogenesis protein CcdA [Bacteroidales bacterium]|nr:cytochrome c biogenesis protein CcdA [Bacteroidales bacterium]
MVAKKILLACSLVLALSFSVINLFAQVEEPVKWTFSTEKIDDTHVNLIFKAKIEDKWHLYSSYTPVGGPVAMFFSFEESENFALVDSVIESPEPHTEFDDVFGVDVKSFAGEVLFTQQVELLNKEGFVIKGFLDGQACVEGTCVPVTADFAFGLNGAKVDANGEAIAEGTPETPMLVTENTFGNAEDKESLFFFFIIAFLGGLLAILTPCVFPMIPMTISFFMKESNKIKARLNAFAFGISIVLIYTFAGSILAIIFGPSIANWLSTHWIPNTIFFLIFMIFAASFFGAFEIVMPSKLVNKSDSKVDKGGVMGAFFMALTLVLVSFSCTGPIVGSILVESFGGSIIKPIIGMLGFALAFALPFTLLALFPGWLKNMPKSGGWLNTVKVVLGFIEVAFGFKFLSVVDQTYHLGWLDRQVYLAIWIVVFTMMGFYLLGKLKFKHDDEVKHIGIGRLGLSMVTFCFVLYMIPGMWGAPLKALSGYLPPITTHYFNIPQMISDGNMQMLKKFGIEEENSACVEPKYKEVLHLPFGLVGYFDYKQAFECAKAQNKPIFIDFTGHGCVNCREMETRVWSDPRVLEHLRNDFIVLAMYVDDKEIELPEEEWFKSKNDGRMKKTLGQVNADIQIVNFNKNAQPYYVLISPDGKVLAQPRVYNLDADKFVEFLENGLKEFEKIQKAE